MAMGCLNAFQPLFMLLFLLFAVAGERRRCATPITEPNEFMHYFQEVPPPAGTCVGNTLVGSLGLPDTPRLYPSGSLFSWIVSSSGLERFLRLSWTEDGTRNTNRTLQMALLVGFEVGDLPVGQALELGVFHAQALEEWPGCSVFLARTNASVDCSSFSISPGVMDENTVPVYVSPLWQTVESALQCSVSRGCPWNTSTVLRSPFVTMPAFAAIPSHLVTQTPFYHRTSFVPGCPKQARCHGTLQWRVAMARVGASMAKHAWPAAALVARTRELYPQSMPAVELRAWLYSSLVGANSLFGGDGLTLQERNCTAGTPQLCYLVEGVPELIGPNFKKDALRSSATARAVFSLVGRVLVGQPWNDVLKASEQNSSRQWSDNAMEDSFL